MAQAKKKRDDSRKKNWHDFVTFRRLHLGAWKTGILSLMSKRQS